MIKKLLALFLVISLFIPAYIAENINASALAGKPLFFLTINNFKEGNRGGWSEDSWTTAPDSRFPSRLLIYRQNAGDATTDIYISEPGKYRIMAYYRTHVTDLPSRWFRIGVADKGDVIDYGSYQFAKFTSAPEGVTTYFEGWDSGYELNLSVGIKTVGLQATTLGGKVRCAAIVVCKADEAIDPSSAYKDWLDWQDYTPPEFDVNSSYSIEDGVKLCWEPAGDNNLAFYEIYKNGILYDTVLSGCLSYSFLDMDKWEEAEFEIAAVDSYCNYSKAIKINYSISLKYKIYKPEGYVNPIARKSAVFKDSIGVENTSPAEIKVSFFIAAYNSDEILEKIAVETKSVKAGNSEILSADLKLSWETDKVRTFLFDENFCPLSMTVKYQALDESLIDVRLEDENLSFSQPAVVYCEAIMVPGVEMLEALGVKAVYSEDILGILSMADNREIIITEKTASLGGIQVDLQVEPYMKNGILMVPLDFITYALSAQLNKTDDTLVTITDVKARPVFIGVHDFSELGSWTLNLEYSTAFSGACLTGLTKSSATAKNAKANVSVNKKGSYRIWVRSIDFPQNSPGTRKFNLKINGSQLTTAFGTHGKEGFNWQDGGVIELDKGDLSVELVDSSKYYARCDGIYITPYLDEIPSSDTEQMKLLSTADKPDLLKIRFPVWAKAEIEPVSVYTLENNNIKIEFSSVNSYNPVIQKQTFINNNGIKTAVDNKTDGFGYLLMISDESEIFTYKDVIYPKYYSKYEDKAYVSDNYYEAAYHKWLIPDKIYKTDDIIYISAENEYALLTAKWELPPDGFEPIVTCRLKAKKQANYSLGAFQGAETSIEETDFAAIPFRIQGKGLPQTGALTLEMYASTPMSSMTLINGVTQDSKLTFGIIAEPKWLSNEFLYRDNVDSSFGLVIHGKDGGVQTGIFSPVLGSEKSEMKKSEEYEFSYRPTVRIGDWYDTFRHASADIFEMRDYRKNYNSSLSDTIFNVRKLMMDDIYSGWDESAKGHYYMETANTVSQGNPLIALQDYLLTGNEEILDRRAVPTLAGLLSRESKSFLYDGSVQALGEPTADFGTTVFGGAYKMTGGMSPSFKKIGIDSGKRNGVHVLPSFSEEIWYYKYTGDESSLARAKQTADNYLNSNIYKPRATILNGTSFVNSTYAPPVAPLLDMYEITGEKKYLDGAEAAARLFTTTLWTAGIDSGKIDDDITVTSEMIKKRDYFSPDVYNYWWNGSKQWRLGFPFNEFGNTRDSSAPVNTETVPSWVVSRVGLGVEQTSTFRNESLNIMMSNWAPDLLRVAAYTGDKLLEAYARNAILGRGENYPGYYYNRKMAIQTHESYPYEGPDYTSIYYHHIPVYLAVLEDYLITQMWSWSNQKINFPYIREQGYAYFWNRQYGFEAGSFFDEQDMWLWLDDGIIETDNIQIDWVAARKSGKAAFALMNEDFTDITATVKLSKEIPSLNNYNGTAVIYDSDGKKRTKQVINGEISVTIPSHQLIGIVIEAPDLPLPEYINLNPNGEGITEVTHEHGKAHLIQASESGYYSYVYTTYLPSEISRVDFKFSTDNINWKTITANKYPFEGINKENDINKDTLFYMEIYDKNGIKIKTTPQYKLSTIK